MIIKPSITVPAIHPRAKRGAAQADIARLTAALERIQRLADVQSTMKSMPGRHSAASSTWRRLRLAVARVVVAILTATPTSTTTFHLAGES